MTRAIHHTLASAAQFAEKFVVAENRRRGGLLNGCEGCLGWGLRAGRIGVEVNGGIEQAAEAEVIRRVGWDDRSQRSQVRWCSWLYSVRAHSTVTTG